MIGDLSAAFTQLKCRNIFRVWYKALLKSDVEYEVVLIDATETPIERPKKSKSTFIQERRKSIL